MPLPDPFAPTQVPTSVQQGGLPEEYQSQIDEARRRQAMATMLMQRAFFNPQPTEMVSGIAIRQPILGKIAQGLLGYAGVRQGENAEKDIRSAQERFSTDQQAALQQLSGMDTKQAIATAMASRFPAVQAIGRELRKQYEDRLGKIAEAQKETDPGAAVGTLTSGNMPQTWQPPPIPNPAFSTSPGGNEIVTTYNRKKEPETKFAPVPLVQNVGPRADLELIKRNIEITSPGGKTYDSALAAQKGLTTAQEIVGQLDQGAKTGVFASGEQLLRSVGEKYLAMPNASTAPTAEISALLKNRIKEKLGTLGSQVSDADRKFMQEGAGDLSTHPEALIRLLAIDSALNMKEINRHNERVDALSKVEGLSPALVSSNYIPFTAQFGEGEYGNRFSSMLDNAFSGKTTSKDMPSLPAATPKAPMSLDDYLKQKGIR